MREIKFRGKRLDTGEWVFGYYCRYGYVGQEKDYIIPLYASALYAVEVDPATVGQYTGLKDKHGQEKIEGRNSCEYCNPDKPKVFMSAKTPHGRIQSFIESGGILDMDYPGGIRAKRINYCPICGRKFREEDNHAK